MVDMELLEAVRSGNIAAAGALAKACPDINQLDKNGWTLLNWAAGTGKIEMVRLLIGLGADVCRTGRDMRTPGMIARAAGHAEAAALLEQAEAADRTGAPMFRERNYCAAYYLRGFRDFPGWSEAASARNAGSNGSPVDGDADRLSDDDIAYLHEDYTVSKSIWKGEDVIFDDVTPQWTHFCAQTLGFKPPSDLDLIVPAGQTATPAASAT